MLAPIKTTFLTGDSRTMLATLPAGSAQCCVTSPPYFNLRDYKVAAQIGMEASPDAYVAELVGVFREVRRVLADDGVMWINIGDSYAGGGGFAPNAPTSKTSLSGKRGGAGALVSGGVKPGNGIKAKDLVGIPWMLAFALRADGWYLRSSVIWHKPNPMPESVRDRPTCAYEHVFLLSRSPRYYYDADAIAEPALDPPKAFKVSPYTQAMQTGGKGLQRSLPSRSTKNARNVWSISPKVFKGAHFATMPPALVERCILSGSRPGDTILDPFAGAGTTSLVAQRMGRNSVGIELNPDYVALATNRINSAPWTYADGVATSCTAGL